MSYSGPPYPNPQQPGPYQPGSYGWSAQGPQSSPAPRYDGQPPYIAATQPGTLPLRPMKLGDYFSSMFATIRKSPGLFFGAALIFGSITAMLAATGEFLLTRSLGSAVLDPTAQFDQVFSGLGLGFFGASLLSQVVMLLGQTFSWGLYSAMVARGAIGLNTSLSQGFRLMRGQWGRLVGLLGLLIAAVIVVWLVAALLGFAIVAIAFAGGQPETGAGAAATVLGALLVAVLPFFVAVFLAIRWHLVIPTMIVEDIGLAAALRRSWRLTRGYFWRTLGIVLLFAIILGFVAAIITAPLSFVSGFIVATAGTEAQLFGTILVVNLLITALSSLVSFIVTNMAVLISIFFYFDYRFRKEGLNLHFQQLAAQHGDASTPDRFDTSGQQHPRSDDAIYDIVPGRHAAPTPASQTGSSEAWHRPPTTPPQPPGTAQRDPEQGPPAPPRPPEAGL